MAFFNTYRELSPPPIQQNGTPTVVTCNNKLYVMSHTSEEVTPTQAYDPATNTWEILSKMPAARGGYGAAAVGGKIYCIGGVANSTYSNKVEIYNTQTDTWSAGASIPMGATSFHAIAYGNKIYCHGGLNTSVSAVSFYVYDTVTNTWSTLSGKGIYGYASALYQDNIYYFGGNLFNRDTGAQTRSDVSYIYNISNNKWTTLNTDYRVVFCVNYKDKFYTADGDVFNLEVSKRMRYAIPIITISYPAMKIIGDKMYMLKNNVHYEYSLSDNSITERYRSDNGLTLEPDVETMVPLHAGYTGEPKDFEGYTYAGYTLDNDPTIYTDELIIDPIESSHTVTYIYTQNKLVREFYETTDGETAAPPTATIVTPGGSYAKEAPELEGFAYLGYHIGNGGLQQGRTVLLETVQDDYAVTFLYQKEGPITLTERFLNSDGTPVLPQNTLYPEPGTDYQNTAPRLEGYKRVGHKIDGGEPQTTRTARLTDIQQSHVVTFLYEPCDGENCIDYEYIITESYYDVENETFILPDTFEYLNAGEGYRKTAPRLAGYNRVGHRVDGGEAATVRTAVIEDVQANHHVFFLYEPCDGENCIDYPGGPGDGEDPNPNPGPGGGENPNPGPGDGGDSCNCGDECHCEDCTCVECIHGGGNNPNPGPGGGENPDPGDGENPNPGPGGGENPDPGDGENPDPGPGGGENPDPGDGENPDPGPGGGNNGNQNQCCGCNCMPMMPCMPVMMMPVMMMPCMPCMPCAPMANWSCGCTCNPCKPTTKPTPTPQPGDEDDVDDCNDPI